ncbi:MAG TPA: PSD1 and planctomycete cytochrome C domain-containing protein [Lacipirellulaceae bacterium]|nr:PSD1 and planctomycete cytochrome C domain-containing protein [Lacipirellulaceae bacterium]
MSQSTLLCVATACALLAPSASSAERVDFLAQIKPILAGRCYACHSGLRQRSGLRLDTAALLIKGGDSGPAVVPGNSQESLLVSMLTGESGVRMPPEEEGTALSSDQIALVKRWIDEGAMAPDEPAPPDATDHWAYHPPERPPVPNVKNESWVANPVDAFLAVQHEANGLVPVEPADKATLLRRVYFDLIGLPPTRDELRAFLADDSPDAYERAVDRLLDSPQYGERWARHWMDVWRYSDWAGYEQEIRNSARHIWRWRDWIIDSLNADKGYDRMLVEMLAGDEIAPTDPDVLRATGFLARNWYKFNRNTWLDNTVEHTAKAFLGVTMNCCRCHDHKYDPISQAEYYEFRAIFEPYDVRTDRVAGEPDISKDGLPRVCDLKPDEPTYLFERGNELRPDKENPLKPGVPAALGEALEVVPVELSILARYPALREFAIKEDLAAAGRLVAECEAARIRAQTTVAEAQKTDGEPPAKEQAMMAAVAAAELESKKLATARAAQAALSARTAAERSKYGLSAGNTEQLALVAAKTERELALCQAQEQHFAADQELKRLRSAGMPDAAATSEKIIAAEKKVAEVAAQVATAHAALATPGAAYQPLGEQYPATSTGRRLAFARWVTDRKNPLAARVAINHIWLRHFGAPLVDNMFDFGLRAKQPRNQALLDWLALELMDNDWKMKHIHRLLVTSSAYRMKSDAGSASSSNVERDRDNHLLWRMNTRRLEAEAVRDALFYVAGSLDQTQGGPDIGCHAAADTPRRSIYFRHAYEKQMKFLEIFDAASTNECYRRSESIVPLQALALANSAVSIEQSRLLAKRLCSEAASHSEPEKAFVEIAFEQILGRAASAAELTECRGFLTSQAELLGTPEKLTAITGGAKTPTPAADNAVQRARENLTHVLLNHNDFVTVR